MIVLKQPDISFDNINASPFCQKLKSFLLFHNIPFTEKKAIPNHGPYQKVPFVEYQGKTLGDSDLIIQQLTKDLNLPTNLSYDQVATGTAWQRLLEDHLYWVLVYCRWIPNEQWLVLKQAFFGPLPLLPRTIIAQLSRNQVRRTLKGQGFGRFSLEQVVELGLQDLTALDNHLNNNTFICGDNISHYDFYADAIISALFSNDLPIAITKYEHQFKFLKTYQERVAKEFN